jgi:hydroxypyruvate isomerase
MNTESLSRRTLIAGAASAAAAAAAPGALAAQQERVIRNGRIRQSVCQWCYGRIPLRELAAAARAMGLESIEILGPEAFPTLKEYGLSCAMTNSHGIPKGINDPANHEACLEAIAAAIDATAEAGFPNVITFSGNRDGMPDSEGLENCVTALKQIVGHAEQKGVTICMELLNSKVNHADYMADNMPWLVELVDRVASNRFKILYDIYHAQVMEGDVIRTIRDYHEHIGHYHTAGNPGRNELDEDQELYYPAIMRAILETGYTGIVGQEFIPKSSDKLAALAHGVGVCDV